MNEFFKSIKLFELNILLLSILILCISCSKGETTTDKPVEPTEIIPTNLSLTIDVVGSNNNNLNGNGSGLIKCTATATNAVSFTFRFVEGSEFSSTDGQADFIYATEGTNTYTVKVDAFSSTGNSINISKSVTVNVTGPIFSTLVFSDEFDTDGAPDETKWGYDLGTGSNGWGNNESQYYTNRSDNVIVEGGLLKITAKKENYQGSEYTSTRMLTKGKYDFKYGRVEVKAKLPEGGGTWPAVWMLGSNISTVGWPACGEIDIMEHVGNNFGTVHASIHSPSSFGATKNTGANFVSDVGAIFHLYSVTWTPNSIAFYIDDIEYYTYNPSVKNTDTWPFNKNQFIILNVAMGGNFGGNIDTAFTQSTMEIDYVRVYQ